MEFQKTPWWQKERQEKTMKYYFLNDTGKNMGIHQASLTDKLVLKPGEGVWVDTPGDDAPWIKVWTNMVLLSHAPIPQNKDDKDG
jgi:hypothetical protein